jgi:hypothetical protein
MEWEAPQSPCLAKATAIAPWPCNRDCCVVRPLCVVADRIDREAYDLDIALVELGFDLGLLARFPRVTSSGRSTTYTRTSMDRSPSQVSQRRQGSPGAHCSCIFAMHDCYGSRADVPSSLRALTVRDSPPGADALVAALPPGPLFALMAGSSCRLMPSVPLLL